MSCCLGPLEREILEISWEKDCPSVKCVLVELNKSRKKTDKLAYTTVMTIMKRLVKKKILVRKKDGRCYRYETKETKEEFVRRVSSCTIQSLKSKFGDVAIEALRKELK